MTLLERINSEFTAAMKAKDQATLSTLRLLKSALKNKQIDLMHELSEEEAMAVVKTQIKQLKDSIEEFKKANREDMIASAAAEAALLEAYLPAQMDDAALEATVKQSLAEAGISSKADMGKAMGVAMKAVNGQADGGRVKAVVAAILTCLVLVVASAMVPHGAVHAATAVAAASHSQTEATESFLIPVLRIGRSFLLLLGLVAVNMILVGGFIFMTASGRDHGHEHSMAMMAKGVLATIFIAALFSIATVAIGNMS